MDGSCVFGWKGARASGGRQTSVSVPRMTHERVGGNPPTTDNRGHYTSRVPNVQEVHAIDGQMDSFHATMSVQSRDTS